MRYFLLFILLPLDAVFATANTVPLPGNSRSLVEIGRRIYQEGIRENGELLQGRSAAQVMFKGKQAACTVCHRKSGYGSSEGKNIIRPIVGNAIFSSKITNANTPERSEMHKRALFARSTTRAAYTQESFANVLRIGIDYEGQELDHLMPRYELSDNEVVGLEEYLKTLSSRSDPGVDEETIHFATVVMPGAEARQTQAMLDVLHAFFSDKNGGSRSDVKRRTVGSEVMYRSYRRWVLDIWNLTGPKEGWDAQLEANYIRQPVFSILSSIGGESWGPLHDFCERREIPCVFPNSKLPITDNAYYSFYFSRGMTLEAEVLAKYFAKNSEKNGTILQLFNENEKIGEVAAQDFRASLNNSAAKINIIDIPISATMDAGSWRVLLKKTHPDSIVVWLSGEDLRKFGDWNETQDGVRQLYFSATMLGSAIGSNPGFLAKSFQHAIDQVHLIYPYELPQMSAKNLLRTTLWMRAKKIEVTELEIQANSYFAAMVVGDSISHILDQFSRDYFIERLEHMVARSLVTSVYPRLSLGPGQRFASKGAYIVKYSQQKANFVEPLSEWIVP